MKNFIDNHYYSHGDSNLSMTCPMCPCQQVHIEGAHVSARHEDRPFTEIQVMATGRVSVDTTENYGGKTITPQPGPVGSFGEGRRQRVSLLGYCEYGCQFAIVFTQHKGDTIVQAVPVTDVRWLDGYEPPTGKEVFF